MKQLVLAIALAGIFVISRVDGYACFVITPEVPEAFDSARAVFVGEVMEIRQPLTSEPDAPLADRFFRVRFKVKYSWKGAGFREFGAPEIFVLSNQRRGCLSSISFHEGQKYLVYTVETPEKNLVVQLGNRTASLSNASEDLKQLERMSRWSFKFQYKHLSPEETIPITCFINC